MPAPVSSLIPAPLAADSGGGSLSESDLVALWDVVSIVPGPRSPQGIRYPLATILALSLAATVAGAGTFEQLAAWSADLPSYRRHWFAVGRDTPSPDTFAPVLGLIDADVLDALLSAWVAARTSAPTAVALDGKALRGARSADGDMMHLVSMVDHTSGVPLGQVDACRAKGYEIPAFRTVLDRIGLGGLIITAWLIVVGWDRRKREPVGHVWRNDDGGWLSDQWDLFDEARTAPRTRPLAYAWSRVVPL